ncbi:glycosyltransferase involved in cell wall biosynthesis [Paenibacillus castaneae]|uniref:glycosyltransferase n=1 Tax=Paenibacillus castaneae TaxID=474957 RepID=UPI000C9B70D7|nr:glycosyltransferase [Paenibacillus castaneae]NIK78355.1 glycosyltransferase involved in cell wall biosynthesis [Paenibacillus castaneae]
MKWAILLGSPDISGGSYVIFEHAIRAKKNGEEVTIITEEKVNMERLHWHPEARILNWRTYDEAMTDNYDICIATWWRTVYEITRITASTYAYFVQSIESRFYDLHEKPLRQLVESTYHLPLHIITEATWIQMYLKTECNKSAYLVKNGIRKDIYSTEGERYAERKQGKLRILVEGPIDVGFKNVPKTIELCRNSKADEIWLLTSSPVDTYPGVDRVFSRVPIFETANIYRSCDVIIKLSYVEGMFGPPLEMFHCGGTSITYNVTGHDEYIVSDYNGLVAQKDDDKRIIEYINMLKEDSTKLNELKVNALKTAGDWHNWDEAAEQFVDAVHDIFNNKPHIEKEELKKNHQFFFEWYVIAEDYKNVKLSASRSIMFEKLKKHIRVRYPKFHQKLRKIKFSLIARKG